MKDKIKTGENFFGLKIILESSGEAKVDAAIKTLFHDQYRRTSPLGIDREDSQIVLKWMKKK